MAASRWRQGGAAAVAVLALFAGRWLSVLLATRWWAEGVHAGAAPFVTGLALLRLVLDAGGTLVASAWFIGHALVVTRAIRSVESLQRVADGEVRRPLTPRAILWGAVAAGGLLGVLAGGDASRHWPAVALAWAGAAFGVREPLLGQDAGLYVAQLPLWLAVQRFALALALIGLALVLTLYAVIGAVRWIDRRPALNAHARRHLGWLLGALALAVAAGFVLEPFRLVGGGGWSPTLRAAAVLAPALAGIAVVAAIASGYWAERGRHALLVGAWLLLGGAATLRWVLTPLVGRALHTVADPASLRTLESAAYGLQSLDERPAGTVGGIPVLGLWWPAALRDVGATDSSSVVVALDAAPAPAGSGSRAAWLLLRREADGTGAVVAVADDRVARDGAPLFVRAPGTDPLVDPVLLSLSPHAVRPDAPPLDLARDARGPATGGLARRVALAWARQSTALLAPAAGGSLRAAWHLEPWERLHALAPFAEWGGPAMRLVDGRLSWVAPGYSVAPYFPLTARQPWNGRQVALLRADYWGVIDAEAGTARVYLRADASPVGRAWATLAPELVEPEGGMPATLRASLPYPAELLRRQAALVAARLGAGVRVAGGEGGAAGAAAPDVLWPGPGDPPSLAYAFEDEAQRQTIALLAGGRSDGVERLRLLRLGAAPALPAAATLAYRWARFATFAQLKDSVQAEGGTLETGPVRLLEGGGAVQASVARPAGGRARLAWLSLAVGDRLGAGRTPEEAWGNLQGVSAPLPPGTSAPVLEQARGWLRTAERALRAGDLATFGRAFEELKRILGVADGPSR